MRYLKYLLLLALLTLPVAYSQAQVAIGVQIGPSYGIYNAPPVCAYGFYPTYPFACAPYGYYGPNWFVSGVFIGAGPWYNFYYVHPAFYRPFYFNSTIIVHNGFHDGFHSFHSVAFHDDGFHHFDGHDHFDHDHFRGEGFHSFHGGSSFRGDAHTVRAGNGGFHNEGFRSFNDGPRGFNQSRGPNFSGGGRGFQGAGGHSFSQGGPGGMRGGGMRGGGGMSRGGGSRGGGSGSRGGGSGSRGHR